MIPSSLLNNKENHETLLLRREYSAKHPPVEIFATPDGSIQARLHSNSLPLHIEGLPTRTLSPHDIPRAKNWFQHAALSVQTNQIKVWPRLAGGMDPSQDLISQYHAIKEEENISFLLNGLTHTHKKAHEIALDRLLATWERELQSTPIPAWEKLLTLATLSASKKEYTNVFLRTMSTLIYSLEKDTYTPQNIRPQEVNSLLEVYNALHQRILNGKETLEDPLEVLSLEKFTRLFKLVSKEINISYSKYPLNSAPNEGENIKRASIFDMVREIRRATTGNPEIASHLAFIEEGTHLLALDKPKLAILLSAVKKIEKALPKAIDVVVKKGVISAKEGSKVVKSVQEVRKGYDDLTKDLNPGSFLKIWKKFAAVKRLVDGLKQSVTAFSEGKKLLQKEWGDGSITQAFEKVTDAIEQIEQNLNERAERWYTQVLFFLASAESGGRRYTLNDHIFQFMGEGDKLPLSEWQWHCEKIEFFTHFLQYGEDDEARSNVRKALNFYYTQGEVPEEIRRKLSQTAWKLARSEDSRTKEVFQRHMEVLKMDPDLKEKQKIEEECFQYWRSIEKLRERIDPEGIPAFDQAVPTTWSFQPPAICEYEPCVATFVVREGLLQEMETQLMKGNTNEKTVALVLAGLGGVGKTQLASKFIEKNVSEFTLIWHFDGQSEETLNQSYREFAERVKLVAPASEGGGWLGALTGWGGKKKETPEELLHKVNDWLSKIENRGWLLYFDNVEDPKTLEQKFPYCGGRILITSRQREGWNTSALLSVPEFTREESVALLKKWIPAYKGDPESIQALAEELGELPLALAQAGSLIGNDENRLLHAKDYLIHFQRERSELWKGAGVPGYPKSVVETWQLNINYIKDTYPLSAEVFTLCAYLDPDTIPTHWLANWLIEKKQLSFEDYRVVRELNHLIRPLINFSLLYGNKPIKIHALQDTLRMNRLVQCVVQDSLSTEEQKRAIQEALALTKKEFERYEEENLETWQVGQVCLAPALCVVKYALAFDEIEHCLEILDKEKIAFLYCQAAGYVKKQGDLAQAKEYYKKALLIRDLIYEGRHPLVADTLNRLALVESSLGHKQVAVTHYDRALNIYRGLGIYTEENAVYEQEHLGLAWSLMGLGNALREHEFGERYKAKEYLEQAVHILETVYGGSSLEVTYPLVGLGNTFRTLRNYERSKECLERALNIRVHVYGKMHPEVAYALIGLGNMAAELGRHEEGRVYLERALTIRKENYGENHPEVALLLENIGNVLCKWGRVYKGNRMYREALEKCDEAINKYYSVARSIYEGIPGLEETHRGAFYLEMNLKEALDTKEKLKTLLNTPEKQKCVIL